MTREPSREDAPSSRAALRIEVTRTGGFAGIPRSWAVDETGDPDRWVPLIDACPWGQTRADAAARDRFVWRIEVRRARRTRRAAVPDRDLVGPWRDLVDAVQASTAPAGDADGGAS